MSRRRLYRVWLVLLSGSFAMLPRSVAATNILWDGTGSSWNSVSSWSLFSNATTPNPAAKPGAADTAIFNIEIVNTPQTVNLNAAQAAQGLFFSSTGSVTIQTGTGTNTLTLGSGGITVNPGAGIDTITSALALSAPQTWTNDSSSLLKLSGAMKHAGHALTIDGSGNTAINGSYALAGTLPITKNGAGTLSINATSDGTASANVLLHAGKIVVENPATFNGIVEGSLVFAAGSTGTFALFGSDVRVLDFSTNAVVGTPFVQNDSAVPATLIVGKFNSPQTFAGVLRDGIGGSLGITVQGPMTLSGANLHTGVTEVSGLNVLKLEHANALGNTSGGTVISAGTLDLRGLSIVGEPLSVSNGAELTNSSVTPAAWTGDVNLSGGSGDEFTVQGIGDITFSGSFSGSFTKTLVKIGPNTLDITGATNNSTSLRVSDGVARLAKTSSSVVRAADSITVDGGTVQLAGTGGDQIFSRVDVESGTFDVNGRNETMSTLTLSGSGIGGAGALVNTASGDSVLTMPDPFSLGAIRIESFARIGVTQTGASLTLDANFSQSGGDFQKVGPGTLILNGDNADYFGQVFLSAGTIAVGSNTALGIGTLTFDGGALRAEGAPRTIARPMTASSTGVVTGAVDLTLAGIISGTAGLTKNDTGRLTLTAANSYASLTTINGGTLAVDGSIPGSVEVNTGATLAGTGTIGGSVTLNAGGTVAPGASPESLSVGSLAMMAASTIRMEIGGTTPVSGYDQLLATGSLAFDGTLEVSLINSFAPNVGDTFNIFDGTISGTFDVLNLPSLMAGKSWNTSQLYTIGVLSVAAGQPGNFDFDGDVDGRDFLIWQRGGSPIQLSAGDLGDWQANYGVGALVATNVAVPEPTSVALAAMLALMATIRRDNR
jgi:fibronectin-binding autotransporter adhesin